MKHLQRFKLFIIPLIIAFILFSNFNILAQNIDYVGVEKVALNVFSLNSNKNISNLKIKEVIPVSNDGEIAFYIFNFEPQGHIVVSNDKAFEPILGFGLNSTIDFDSIPPGLKYLLGNFKNEINYARKHGLIASKATNAKWDNYLNLVETSRQKSYSTGTYLLQTIWGQDLGFNRFCPFDPNTNNRTIVGCGGVALGQILYYWLCRVFPDGSISYSPNGFPSPISLNFYGQNYNWSGMSKTSPDDYNALLLYHSAVSIRSNFTDSSTSSYTNYARNALVSYFGFNANITQYKSSFTDETWINMLKSEIDAERPIFYAGYDNSENSGHAWVLDGYNSNNQFHCNWGWHRQNNSSDWYLLSALNVGEYSFNDGQSAILNIFPLLDSCSGLTGSSTICASNTSYSITIPSSASVIWSKTGNLTQVGVNNDIIYTVHPTANSQSGSGSITSTIYNSNGQVFLSRTKDVWIGKPTIAISNFSNLQDLGYNNYYKMLPSTGTYPYSGSLSVNSSGGNNNDAWGFYANIPKKNIAYWAASGNSVDVGAKTNNAGEVLKFTASNNCATTNVLYTFFTGDMGTPPPPPLVIIPNPATTQAEVSIAEAAATSDEYTAQNVSASANISYSINVINSFGVSVYSAVSSEKKIKIPTTSILNGIYIVRLTDGVNIYQGNLVVNH